MTSAVTLSQLMDEKWPMFVDVAYKIVKNVPLAEDCVQEACVNVLKALEKKPIEYLYTYTYRTVQHLAIEATRRFWYRNIGELPEDFDAIYEAYDANMINNIAAMEKYSKLLTAFPTQRELLELMLEGYEFEEIAEKLHINPIAARVRMCRLRKRAKALLEAV